MKKHLALALAIIMALLFVGCSSTAVDQQSPADQQSDEKQSPAAESVAPEESARPGFNTLTDADINIGVSLMDMENLFKMAVKKGNEAYCKAHNYPIQVTAAESSPEKQVIQIHL